MLEDILAAVPPDEMTHRLPMSTKEALGSELESVIMAVAQFANPGQPSAKLGQPPAKLVLNGHPASMKVHLIRQGGRAACGWKWESSQEALVVNMGHKYLECRSCFKS